MTSQETSSRTAREAEDELAHTLRVMTRLQEIAALYVQAGNLQPILLAIVDAAIEFADADYGNIQLIDGAGTLRIAAHRGFPQWWLDFWNSVNHGNGACGTALERAERVIVEDVEKDPIFIGTEGLDPLLKVGVRAVQSTPLVSRSGKALGMFSTHYRATRRPDDGALRLLDILARQAAEIIDRAQAEIALRNSEERLRVALDASRAGSWSWDANTNASIWDDRFLEMYEFPTNIVQRFDTWAGRLHPDDQERILARIAQMQVTPGDDRWLEEFRCVLPEGGIVWHMGVGQAQRDPDGHFNGLTGIVIDITQRKAAEEAFARSQKMEALGKLTGGIAHDMNNLFLVIYGNLELAEAGLGNSEAKHAIGKALTAIQQGSNLNQRLLAFASRLSLAPKRISLNSSISEIALLLRRTLGEHIELETKLDDTLW
jgi:PAS domain S-box-containing protein